MGPYPRGPRRFRLLMIPPRFSLQPTAQMTHGTIDDVDRCKGHADSASLPHPALQSESQQFSENTGTCAFKLNLHTPRPAGDSPAQLPVLRPSRSWQPSLSGSTSGFPRLKWLLLQRNDVNDNRSPAGGYHISFLSSFLLKKTQSSEGARSSTADPTEALPQS